MSLMNKRVLVIDDDPDIHAALRTILEPRGCWVTCCAEGPAGIDAMRRQPPDVLLLDIMMTTPSEGFHVLYEIREDSALRDIPVIVVSSIGRETGMNFAADVGTPYIPADAFVEKPFDPEKLVAAIDAVLPRPRNPAHAPDSGPPVRNHD